MKNNDLQSDYILRVDRVFEFIENHLNEDLSLSVLAEIAHFSPFHFHRIFRYITQETVLEYVTRQRIEKAASRLIHGSEDSSEIAFSLGFQSLSSFSRSFKNFYGVRPTDFRLQNPNTFSKIRQMESKIGQVYPNREQYLRLLNELKIWTQMNAKIEIVETAELNVAGVMHIGLNNVEQGFNTLIRWANKQHLMQHPETCLGRVFYDSAKITPPNQVRQHVFLKTSQPFETEGVVRNVRIFGGQHIVSSYEIAPHQFEKAWTGLFAWMNEQGYQKRDASPYEIYHNDYHEHPEGKFLVDLYIPIE